MNKQHLMSVIVADIHKCKECKKEKTGLAVVGEGNLNAEIAFIGEAPGKTEAKTGRPFVGRSGKFLRGNIVSAGLREEDVYITSPVKYLPLRGTPTPADIAHGMTHLSKQLSIIDPKVIVLMGSVACLGVLGEKIAVAKEHGTIKQAEGKTYFIMYHPAAGIRFMRIRKIFLEDFKTLKKILLQTKKQ